MAEAWYLACVEDGNLLRVAGFERVSPDLVVAWGREVCARTGEDSVRVYRRVEWIECEPDIIRISFKFEREVDHG